MATGDWGPSLVVGVLFFGVLLYQLLRDTWEERTTSLTGKVLRSLGAIGLVAAMFVFGYWIVYLSDR